MTTIAPSLLRTLTVLRWIAVLGQAGTVFVVIHTLNIPLDPAPLWLGIGALALFNVWAMRRATRVRQLYPLEVIGHLAVDVLILAWLVANAGGVMNPFGSLFLLPIALVTVALPPFWVGVTTALCGLGYAASTLLGPRLPHLHGGLSDAFDLHLLGMTANFIVSTLVVACFGTWLTQTLRQREKELADMKERFTRDEGILALATHAAAVAHELNTPIATLTLMLEDQLDQRGTADPMREDLELMRTLVNACRDRVRDLAAPASGDECKSRTVTTELDRVIERWCLLRPEIKLNRRALLAPDAVGTIDVGIGHLLQALLNNAADASAREGSPQIDLDLQIVNRNLIGAVRDYGGRFNQSASRLPRTLFQSTKPGGLGLGLVLSHATVERLGGELSIAAAEDRGVVVRFSLPLTQ
ncbi:MAG: HAMP domain-containing histidine kinase [Gammaproteobacteria bacterium]|nr:HAMP domain-containing histidine kinase [Gammaproteobacteria bacterium]